MKILLTGGGSGGHFYPLIAIAEKLNQLAQEEKIVSLKLFFMSNDPFDRKLLFENRISYIEIPAGKKRIYSSIKNFFDMFSTMTGGILGLLSMYFIYPDVVISKGGYAAFPAVFAAKLLRIPVIVHESDSSPGRLNVWTSKFAERIAVSWPEAGTYFPLDKTAVTGQPIRKAILHGDPHKGYEFFALSSNLPVLYVVGGSQGAETINNILLEVLPELVEHFQIVHQTGKNNHEEVVSRAKLILENNSNSSRYVPIAYMNTEATQKIAGIATLVVSRAGSSIFEIASWGIPSIIIPITNSNGNHQRKNAYSYARSGGCIVIEESNLTPHLFLADVKNTITDSEKLQSMKEHALLFASTNAAEKIAQVALDIALQHEN